MNILFDWCAQPGVQSVFGLIKTLLNIMRWVVPIGLIIMTSLDIFKKVLNPDDKDGQKKILTRIIAAVIVFCVPILVRLVLNLIDIGLNNNTASSTSASACWR